MELPSENRITGLEINPNGETVATIDCFGICLISDIDTNKYSYHMDMGNSDSGIFNFALYCSSDTYSLFTRWMWPMQMEY